MKYSWKLLFVYSLLLFVVGIFVGRTTKKVETITIIVSDTILVREFIHDTSLVVDTVFTKKDTIVIYAETPLGDIPTRIKSVRDSLPVSVASQRVYLPFDLDIVYRGILYRYEIETYPTPYEITIPAKTSTFDLFASATMLVNYDWRISGAFEGGLSYKKHYAILMRTEVNHEKEALLLVGLQYRF